MPLHDHRGPTRGTKKIGFIDNCEGRRLQVLYEERFSPITGDIVEFIGSFDAPDHRFRKPLAEADIIVMQAIEGAHAITVGDFETSARIIEYPNVTGDFLSPYYGEEAIAGTIGEGSSPMQGVVTWSSAQPES